MSPADMQLFANLTREYADDIESEFQEAEEADDDDAAVALQDLLTALSDVVAHLRDKGY